MHSLTKKLGRRFKRYEKWPVLTLIIIAVLVLVFALQQSVPWREYAFVPAKALSKPWTFVTSHFLHASLDHLMFNLIGLALFGYYVEVVVGRKYLLAVFILAGVAGSFGSLLTIPSSDRALGASSSILGLLSFFAVTHPLHPMRTLTGGHIPALPVVLVYGIMQLIGLFNPQENIAYGSHLAGLIAGILFGIWWRISKSEKIVS